MTQGKGCLVLQGFQHRHVHLLFACSNRFVSHFIIACRLIKNGTTSFVPKTARQPHSYDTGMSHEFARVHWLSVLWLAGFWARHIMRRPLMGWLLLGSECDQADRKGLTWNGTLRLARRVNGHCLGGQWRYLPVARSYDKDIQVQ